MFCHHCGFQIPDRAKFCSRCGREQIPELLSLEPARKNEQVEQTVQPLIIRQDPPIGKSETSKTETPQPVQVVTRNTPRRIGRHLLIITVTISIGAAAFFGIDYYYDSVANERTTASKKEESQRRKKFTADKNKANLDDGVAYDYTVSGSENDILQLSSPYMTNNERRLHDLYGQLDKFRELGFRKIIYQKSMSAGDKSVLDSISLAPVVKKK